MTSATHSSAGYSLALNVDGQPSTPDFGWFATWAEARAKQLELAAEEIPTLIVPCEPDLPVDYGSAPEPQEMTTEWVNAMRGAMS